MYFQAKQMDYTVPDIESRCVALMTANLSGVAASWLQERVATVGAGPPTLSSLENELRAEFEPIDLQQRLRDDMYRLKQKNCEHLVDYIGKFRHLCSQVTDMTATDKMTHFIRGLRLKTREEVSYHRCQDMTDAIQIALEYERSHADSLGLAEYPHHRSHRRNNNNRHQRHTNQPQRSQFQRQDRPIPMDVTNAQHSSNNTRRHNNGYQNRNRNNNDRNTNNNRNNNRSTVRCYRCQGNGHYARDCTRNRTEVNQNNITSSRESVNDDIEIYAASEVNQFAEETTRPLMIVQGQMDGQSVRILIDSGAELSLCKPDIAKTILRTREMATQGLMDIHLRSEKLRMLQLPSSLMSLPLIKYNSQNGIYQRKSLI
jgi:hypothetical protein